MSTTYEPTLDASTRGPGGLLARALLSLLLLVPLTACFSTGPYGDLPRSGVDATAPLGTFSVSSPALSVESAAPRGCVSGEHELFYGFDFPDLEKKAVLRLVFDPVEGAAIRVFDPADPDRRTAVFRPPSCKSLSYLLAPSGWRVNDYRDFHARLDADCETPEGAKLKVSLSARHCS
jgi:hypothetical protein